MHLQRRDALPSDGRQVCNHMRYNAGGLSNAVDQVGTVAGQLECTFPSTVYRPTDDQQLSASSAHSFADDVT